uniref:Sigma factor n=1 Tax=Pelargonium echinatum TaxID=122254 RepID=A0A0G2STT7_9ROSI|nr:sigma factor [Pelargonium echinatum]
MGVSDLLRFLHLYFLLIANQVCLVSLLPSSSSSSARGKEASFNGARLLFLSFIPDEVENSHSHREPLKGYASSSAAPQTLDNDFIELRDMQINRRSCSGLHSTIEDNLRHTEEGISSSRASLWVCRPAHFGLLMENLDVLVETFADSNALRLEREILLQVKRLGALKLFNICLSSRTIETSNVLDLSDVPIEGIKDCTESHPMGKRIVRSGKKDNRKSRRERVLENHKKISSLSLLKKTTQSCFQQPSISSAKRASHSRSRRLMIAKNEAEMARGVKVMADLERIRTTLEEATGQVVKLSYWAEAAGLEPKVLQQRLQFGWQCRDELIRSTRSLVIYLARYYRGRGVAFEDLLQAGNMGVLQGAERFDHNRGCKFSTYVQFWIRKSMLRMVAESTKHRDIPYTLSRAINQIQKAERAYKNNHGKYPDDAEISKITGLSLARIALAKNCPRVFADSIHQKIGENHNVKYTDIIPDTSILGPEEAFMKQQMKKYIQELLDGLDPRESQVLVLRYGLHDHRPRSLREIGEIFHVSKQWIRKLEKKALSKLRTEEICKKLRHYLIYCRLV